MTVSPPPTDLAGQVQWLVDRAQISDLLIEFARALDERDWSAYAATYTDDSVLEVPGAFRFEGREAMQRAGEFGLGRYAGTWHLSANHAISVDADTAEVKSYLHAVHLLSADRGDHADGGGWYEIRAVRTGQGWRLSSVRIREVWTVGDELPSRSTRTARTARTARTHRWRQGMDSRATEGLLWLSENRK